MMSDKPVIFISHSSVDSAVATVLQEQIEKVLGGKDKATVFNSSDPRAIPPGADWFEEIAVQLDRSDLLVVIVTSSAKQSIWVGFEIGYFWNRTKGKHIFPVATPGARSFGPIEKLQAKSLDNPEQIDVFLNHLCKDLNLGDPLKADKKPIIKKAIQNAKATITDSEIRDRIREFILNQHKPQTVIWLQCSNVDKEMKLPKGSAAEYIEQVLGESIMRQLIEGWGGGNDDGEYDIDFR